MKTHLILLLTATLNITIMYSFGAALPNESERKNLKAAEKSFEAGEYEQALEYFKTIDDDASFLTDDQIIEIGLCYYHSSTEKSKAIKYFERALNFKKVIPELYKYLAQSYQFDNRYDEAIIAYEKYLLSLKNIGEGKLLREETVKNIATCYQAKELEDKPMNVKVKNLGGAINSQFADYGSVLSKDGKRLYFTSCIPETGKSEEDGLDNIFYTDLTSQVNDRPAGYTKLITGNHDAILGFSHTGDKMFIHGDGDIYLIKVSDKSKWVASQRLNSAVNSPAKETSIALSPDGKTLYFSSDREGGFGGLDIYRSQLRDNGLWGEPVNLGPTVNTPFDEDAPYINAQGTIFYFSSKGHLSMGGYDVFQVDLEKGALPKNMGTPINSVSDDIYFSVDGKGVGYISSNRKGGFGSLDIYRVTWEPQTIFSTEIQGVVCFQNSYAPLNGTVNVYDKETSALIAKSTVKQGVYSLALFPGKKYIFQIDAENFIPERHEVFVPYQSKAYPLHQNFQFEYILGSDHSKIGQRLLMINGFFDLDTFFDSNKSLSNLDQNGKEYSVTVYTPIMYNIPLEKQDNKTHQAAR